MEKNYSDSGNYSSTDYYYDDDYVYDYADPITILQVTTWIIISISLFLTPIAIFAVYSLVRKDNVAPIYVINLLISDLVQLCGMILTETGAARAIGRYLYFFGLMASVGFMVCIALERYLVIVWPLWYRNRRTIKISLVVCAVVWALSCISTLLYFWYIPFSLTVFGVFLLLPFPLLIFFLAGTLKALSAAISVCADEKRRIVGMLVMVLLIYTLLFLPGIIFFLVDEAKTLKLTLVAVIFFKLSPLADLFLYVFLRKGAVNKVLACLCCCRKDSTSQQSSSVTDGNMYTVTSM